MSRYVSSSGYSGQEQSLVWHYKLDFDRNLINRWLVDVVNQGVLQYVPNAACIGTANLIIDKGTSIIVEEMTAILNGERRIVKLDMIEDFDEISVSGLGNGTYNLIASWENAADATRGVEFFLLTPAQLNTQYTLTGYNYVQLGQVVVAAGVINDNNDTNQTIGSLYPTLSGISGWSGESGMSGWSGTSGEEGISGWLGEASVQAGSGTSGKSGWFGVSGWIGTGGDSGYSGISGYSGTSGRSGWSGVSGSTRSGWSGNSGYAASLPTGSWPIGSVFFTAVSTSPSTLLGFGTWSRVSEGRFVIGENGGKYTPALATGGASTINIRHDHTVTLDTVAAHTHSVSITSGTNSTTAGPFVIDEIQEANAGGYIHTHLISGNTGSGGSHSHTSTVSDSLSTAQSIIPPYSVLYMWRRTA
jgi:hypothetical protein